MDQALEVALEAAQAAIDAAKARHKRGEWTEANIRYGDLQRIVDELVITTGMNAKSS